MRILALADNISSQKGGQEHSLYDVCTGLVKNGHEVHLLYALTGDLLDRYVKNGVQPVSLQRCALSGQLAFRKDKPVKSTVAFMEFLIAAAKIRPDVVYINQVFDVLFAGIYSTIACKPLVCHLRLPPGPICGQWRLGLKHVSRFITISKQTRAEYEAIGLPPGRIEVIYNGIDPDKFKRTLDPMAARRPLGIPQEAFVVGYCGRIDEGKGIDILLRGFAHSGLAYRNGKLLLAGPVCHADRIAGERFVAALKALAKELLIDDSIYWLGHIADVQSFYSACNVLVLPTHGINESFGRVLIEAMACETVAIGSRVGGIPEVLTGEFSSFLFEAGNWHELGLLLERTEQLSVRDATLGKRCRAHIQENFHLVPMIKNVEAILKQTVASQTGRKRLLIKGMGVRSGKNQRVGDDQT
jgi:glycosyltransferase involved in cell wall biosynthesis